MEQMIKAVTSSPLFGIVLCIAAFELGVWLQKKLKTPLCHPLLIAVALIIAVLNNGLNILGVSSYYQDVIKGLVILIAVLSDRKR